MLSDKGIRDYLSKGLLSVEPLGNIGPCSIDLHIGSRLYRSSPQAWMAHDRDVQKLAEKGDIWGMNKKHEEPVYLPFDEFVSRFATPVSKTNGYWVLEPGAMYYTQTAETVTTKGGVHVLAAARSSAARNGIRIEDNDQKISRRDAFNGKIFLTLRTYGTCVELPENHSILQMVVESSHDYLTGDEIREVIRKGEIAVSEKPIIWGDSLYLTFHPKLLRYNGRTMNPAKDSSACFDEIDITHDYVLEPNRFYLASTREIVGMGTKHAGVIGEMSGGKIVQIEHLFPLVMPGAHIIGNTVHMHMNAPYHWPGSNHSLVLEMFSSEPRIIRAGMPACGMFVERVEPECGAGYNSKYNGQSGPVVSRL